MWYYVKMYLKKVLFTYVVGTLFSSHYPQKTNKQTKQKQTKIKKQQQQTSSKFDKIVLILWLKT